MADEPVIRTVSDTAFWTAALRAEESERTDAIFHDPFARRLAGERGFEIVRVIDRPAVRYGVVLRTAAIDRLLLARVRAGCDAVLNLASGFDARAYRIDLPGDLRWIDVDLPAVLDYKAEILYGERPRCRYEVLRLDLSDHEARIELFTRVAAEARRVLVITEGLLAYLPAEAVAALARDLHAAPTFAEWLTELAGNQVGDRVKNAGQKHRSQDARTLFTPAENTAFFLPCGWREAEYIDLFFESPSLGRDSPAGRVLRLGRFVPGLRRRLERGLGVVRLTRVG